MPSLFLLFPVAVVGVGGAPGAVGAAAPVRSGRVELVVQLHRRVQPVDRAADAPLQSWCDRKNALSA